MLTVSGQFTEDGQSNLIVSVGDHVQVHLRGTFTASVTPQYSTDAGETWNTLQQDQDGNSPILNAAVACSLKTIPGTWWRLDCNHTSGTVEYEMIG